MKKEIKASAFKMPSVMSKSTYDYNRSIELVNAVQLCHLAGKRCPDEWLKELTDLNKTFAK